MPTLNYTEALTIVHCTCGIAYAIPNELNQQLLDHCGEGRGTKSVYCPNGHQWHYAGKSAEERIREAEQRTKAVRDLLAAEERSHAATKGKVTKLKKRVEAGVCIHCKRSFVNLARHMQSKHADCLEQ
jgi:hypothetical protein